MAFNTFSFYEGKAVNVTQPSPFKVDPWMRRLFSHPSHFFGFHQIKIKASLLNTETTWTLTLLACEVVARQHPVGFQGPGSSCEREGAAH